MRTFLQATATSTYNLISIIVFKSEHSIPDAFSDSEVHSILQHPLNVNYIHLLKSAGHYSILSRWKDCYFIYFVKGQTHRFNQQTLRTLKSVFKTFVLLHIFASKETTTLEIDSRCLTSMTIHFCFSMLIISNDNSCK